MGLYVRDEFDRRAETPSVIHRDRARKANQMELASFAPFSAACSHEGIVPLDDLRSRRNADAPANSSADAEATEPTDFKRAPKVRTPSVIPCQSSIKCARLSSLSATSNCFRDSSGLT